MHSVPSSPPRQQFAPHPQPYLSPTHVQTRQSPQASPQQISSSVGLFDDPSPLQPGEPPPQPLPESEQPPPQPSPQQPSQLQHTGEGEGIPHELLCPITLVLMEEPVLAEDGH